MPLLVLGAFIGAIFGSVVIPIFGLESYLIYKFIVISMAGFFAATVRSPITGVVLLSEMCGSTESLVAMLIVAIIAYAVPMLLNNRPIYESLFERLLAKNNHDFMAHIKIDKRFELLGIFEREKESTLSVTDSLMFNRLLNHESLDVITILKELDDYDKFINYIKTDIAKTKGIAIEDVDFKSINRRVKSVSSKSNFLGEELSKILESVKKDIKTQIGVSDQFDDETMLILKYE